jgi:hypothetical protein
MSPAEIEEVRSSSWQRSALDNFVRYKGSVAGLPFMIDLPILSLERPVEILDRSFSNVFLKAHDAQI